MGANIILQTGGLSAKDMLAMIVGTEPFSLTAEDLAGLTDVADGAFEGCTTMTSIGLPYEVTSIGARAFCGCENLESITYNGTIAQWQGITKGTDWDYNTGEYTIRCTDGDIVKESLAYSLVSQSYFVSGIGSFTGADLHIPSKYNKMPVVQIDNNAFNNCLSLESVIIPGSITDIGHYAFSGCLSLNSVTIERGVINIGADVFDGCQSLNSISIPDSVQSIGEYAFSGCESLGEIVIPDSVASIGQGAFVGCDSLVAMRLPNDLTNIPSSIFSNCGNLESIIVGSNIGYIGDYIIDGCTALTSITYNGTVTQWGNISKGNSWDQYRSNTGNYTIYCTDGQIAKDGTITMYTDGLAYTLNSDNLSYSCGGIGTATDTDIVVAPVYNGLPVTSIGNSAFEYCSSLTSVTIPDSVASIGYSAFYNCTSLTSITIPDSVISIGRQAFYECTSLTSVTIPDSVRSIDYATFAGCTGLTSITVEEGNPVYHSDGNCLIETWSKTMVAGCKNSVIPTDGSVTSIGVNAFQGCSGLTSVTIPDSVTSIGDWAFLGCSGLTSVTISDSVTSIGNGTFRGCTSLTSITIPDSVTSVGRQVFEYCSSLTSVTIPDSVTSIGSYAFYNCTSLTAITYNGTIAQWNAITKGDSWNTNTGNYTIHCTDGDIPKAA